MLSADPVKRPSMDVILMEPLFQEFMVRNIAIRLTSAASSTFFFWKVRAKHILNVIYSLIRSNTLVGYLRRELSRIHLKDAATVLTDSFMDDPRFKMYDGPKKKQEIYPLFYEQLKWFLPTTAQLHGLFYHSKLIGVSVWWPPEVSERQKRAPLSMVVKGTIFLIRI